MERPSGGAPEVRCPACGGTVWLPLLSKLGHRYVRCATCATARLDPLPSARTAADLYDAAYFEGGTVGGYGDYDGDEALHRRNAMARLALLGAAEHRCGVPTASRILDVGCASGWFLLKAREGGRGTGTGVDVSPWARQRTRDKGFPTTTGLDGADLGAVVEHDGPFGAVTFFQSLEHLVDPLEALRQARSAVATGAPLVVESWDRSSRVARRSGARWQQVSPPAVVWLFDRDGLTGMVERAGFAQPAVAATSKLVSVGMVLTQVGSRVGNAGAPVRRLATGRLGRVAVPYRLGDLVTLTAVAR